MVASLFRRFAQRRSWNDLRSLLSDDVLLLFRWRRQAACGDSGYSSGIEDVMKVAYRAGADFYAGSPSAAFALWPHQRPAGLHYHGAGRPDPDHCPRGRGRTHRRHLCDAQSRQAAPSRRFTLSDQSRDSWSPIRGGRRKLLMAIGFDGWLRPNFFTARWNRRAIISA